MIVNPDHGGNIYNLLDDRDTDEIIDFSANINLLGPPAALEEVCVRARELIPHYPDPEARRFRSAFGGYLGLKPRYILPGNGAAEFIYLLIHAFKPDRVLIPCPTFSEYAAAVINCGHRVQHIKMERKEHFRLPMNQMLGLLPEVDLIFICNPNNPTGTLIPKPDLLELVETAATCNTKVVIDEAFIDFLSTPNTYSLSQEVPHYEHLTVLRSLTKFFALPGLRAGALLASPKIIEHITALKDPWSMNVLAQEVAARALTDEEYIDHTRKIVTRERHHLTGRLEDLGFDVYPSPANFILVQLLSDLDACWLQEKLTPAGVLIRNCATFTGLSSRYIRLAVRNSSDNNRLVELIEDLI